MEINWAWSKQVAQIPTLRPKSCCPTLWTLSYRAIPREAGYKLQGLFTETSLSFGVLISNNLQGPFQIQLNN
jgi:hypothetical protein